jgi:hypothetical protein
MTENALFKKPDEIPDGEATATVDPPAPRRGPYGNCVVCGADLQAHEKPSDRRDPGLCDKCIRGHQTR